MTAEQKQQTIKKEEQDRERFMPRIVIDFTTGKPLTEHRRKKIIMSYIMRGWSFNNIGRVFDVSGSRVISYCEKHGMLPEKRRPEYLTEEEIEAERKRLNIQVKRRR